VLAQPPIAYDGRRLVAAHGAHVPRRIVLHDTESHDVAGIRDLEGIATFWHGVSWGPGSQVGVDSEGHSARYVSDGLISYSVENHNTGTLAIEQVGFAAFSHHVWMLRRRQLETTAWWVAHWSLLYTIPLVLGVERGLSTHKMQSDVYHGTHYDPGRGYPLGWVLSRAKQLAVEGAKPKPPKTPWTGQAYWRWLRWNLGEGEFADYGPADPGHRPDLPAEIPAKWWQQRKQFLSRRQLAAAHQLA
jgi:N-acetylmuramoyl-L-alanine amidase